MSNDQSDDVKSQKWVDAITEVVDNSHSTVEDIFLSEAPTTSNIDLSRKAATLIDTLEYASITLTVANIAIDLWRIGSSIRKDKKTKEHASEIINELEKSIEKLNERLKSESNLTQIQKIKESMKHLKLILNDVNHINEGTPVNEIKTLSSVTFGMVGGTAGGAAGSWVGAETGAAIGSLFGPVGTAIGGAVGAVIGGVGGGISGGILGGNAGEVMAEDIINTQEIKNFK